ncbi:MAG TPA: NAD-dependent epimerase/dehydratase family protein [Euzebya sp.]|nr:NAD-dependent epimerase/dehydratase family protein [Euzebya sp.]
MSGMTVVVTGGAGFIGANLARHLLATDGIGQVRVIDDRFSGEHGNLEGLDVLDVNASILDGAALDQVVAGADAIVHLAARPSVPRSVNEPVPTHAVNATGTVAVLEAARRHGDLHCIVASSSSVYGANPMLPKHEQLATEPLSPYAASKLAAEAYTLAYGASYGLPVLAFRFFNVYGPLQPAGHAYAAVVPAFLEAALAGRPVQVHGDGGQTRDFTYVGSVTRAITQALLGRVTHPRPVNLAFGSRASLLQLIEVLERLLGHRIERSHTDVRAGDVRHSQADQSAFAALFPDLQAVPLDEGLQATIEWFQRI